MLQYMLYCPFTYSLLLFKVVLCYVMYQMPISLHAISCSVMAGKRCLVCFSLSWYFPLYSLVIPTIPGEGTSNRWYSLF